jgi:hypothetical protein
MQRAKLLARCPSRTESCTLRAERVFASTKRRSVNYAFGFLFQDHCCMEPPKPGMSKHQSSQEVFPLPLDVFVNGEASKKEYGGITLLIYTRKDSKLAVTSKEFEVYSL